MRKALSLTLALLMILSSMSLMWIGASAEDSKVPTIKSFDQIYTPKAYKVVSAAKQKIGESKYGADLGFRSTYEGSRAIDGDYATTAQTYGTANQYYKTLYIDNDGKLVNAIIPAADVQSMDDGHADLSVAEAKYYGFFKAEVENADLLGSITLWYASADLSSKTAFNDALDIFASEDGETWVPVASYTGLCGDGAAPGVNALTTFTETLTTNVDGSAFANGESKIFGMKVSMDDLTVTPNYLGFGVAEPSRSTVASNMDMVFGEITANLEDSGSAVPAVLAFESLMAYKARKTAADANSKTRVGDIGFRSGTDYAKAVDGNFATRFVSYGTSSYYASIYVDSADKKLKNDLLKDEQGNYLDYDATTYAGPGKYFGFYSVAIAHGENLGSMTIWGGSDKTSKDFMINGFDIYVSSDKEEWTLVNSYTGMDGDGSNPGANASLASKTTVATIDVSGTPTETTFYGLEIDLSSQQNVNYVGIAISNAVSSNGQADMFIREITVEQKVSQPSIVAFGINNYKSYIFGSKASQKVDSAHPTGRDTLADWRGSDSDGSKAFDGNFTTLAKSKHGEYTDNKTTNCPYYPALYVDSEGKIAANLLPATQDWNAENPGAGKYFALYTATVTNADNLKTVTLWGSSDKTSIEFTNPSYDVLYSQDGETWTLLGSFTGMNGDGAKAGKNADECYRQARTVNEVIYYGHCLDFSEVSLTGTAYVAIGVSERAKRANGQSDDLFREITLNDKSPILDVSAQERVYNYEEPYYTPANGFAVKSVSMGYVCGAFGAGSAQEAQKATADGDLDDVLAWKTNTVLADLIPAISMVDGKMQKFDGEVSDNDYLDYIKLELAEVSNVGSLKWYVGGRNTGVVAHKFDVYTSTDGKEWTLAKQITDGKSADYKKDNEGNWCTCIDVNRENVKFVMIAIIEGTVAANPDPTVDKLEFYVQEIEVMNTSYVFADDESFKEKEKKVRTTEAITTEAPTSENPAAEEDGGCFSIVDAGLGIFAALALGAMTVVKKKKEN